MGVLVVAISLREGRQGDAGSLCWLPSADGWHLGCWWLPLWAGFPKVHWEGTTKFTRPVVFKSRDYLFPIEGTLFSRQRAGFGATCLPFSPELGDLVNPGSRSVDLPGLILAHSCDAAAVDQDKVPHHERWNHKMAERPGRLWPHSRRTLICIVVF